MVQVNEARKFRKVRTDSMGQRNTGGEGWEKAEIKSYN